MLYRQIDFATRCRISDVRRLARLSNQRKIAACWLGISFLQSVNERDLGLNEAWNF